MHVDTEQQCGGWSLQALETKFSSYLWASVFLHGQQCWNVPVTSKANPELDCWVYQGLLEAYHLWWAATGVTCVGTSKERCSLTYFAETCTAESTFLLCSLKKPVYPHPSTTASRYWDKPGVDTFFIFFECETYIYIHYVILIFVLQSIDNGCQFLRLCLSVLLLCVANPFFQNWKIKEYFWMVHKAFLIANFFWKDNIVIFFHVC